MFYTVGSDQGPSKPAIAFFHGGGWTFASPDEFHEACKRYAEKGFITFSFQYRLCINEDGTVPHQKITPVECVKDARSAMRWLMENAAAFNINPAPAAFLLFSSNVNTLEIWADRLLGERREEIWSISPYHNIKAGLPPAIEFHGTEDRMVPYWAVSFFKEKTIQHGNYFDVIVYEGRRHYLGNEDQSIKTYYDEEILERADEFLIKFRFMDPSE